MQKTARAILTYDNKYVFMRRVKIRDGKEYEYYATIGGHLEENETFEEACIREAYEELGVKIVIDELFLEYVNEEINTHENKKGVMYEDLYNVLQQLEPISDSIN